MRAKSGFQLYPKAEFGKLIPHQVGDGEDAFTYEKPGDLLEKLKKSRDHGKSMKFNTKFAIDTENKIDSYLEGNSIPPEEWRELLISTSPINILVSNCAEKIEASIPVLNIVSRSGLRKFQEIGKKRVFCFNKGVLIIRQLYVRGDAPAFPVAFNILKSYGIDVKLYGNDIEINGKKVAGVVETYLPDNYIISDLMITYEYDDELFKHLPDEHYSRAYIDGKPEGEQGITGIKNEAPWFDINKFLDEFLIKLGYGNNDN